VSARRSARRQRADASPPGAFRMVAAVGVVLMGAAGLIYWGVGRSSGPGDVVRDGAPAWSPDGTQIAFYSEVGGRPADLFVMDADGSSIRQLTATPAAEGYPAWSPDGRHIAFESNTPGGNFDVYVMDAGGSSVRRLTDDPRRDVGPTWSPDGRKIAFMSDRAGAEFDLYWMNADGTDVERLTSGQTDWFPQFSPDGSQIAFHRWNDVHLLDLGARGIQRLTTDPDNGMYPAWSPDGSRIAFMSWRSGRTAIYTMQADGSDQRKIVQMASGSAIDPRWSPGEDTIVFVHVPEEAVSDAQAAAQPRILYTVDVRTGTLTRLR